jgi:hypothetical protein
MALIDRHGRGADLGSSVRLGFGGREIAAAIGATFDRRKTPVPSEPPIALGPTFSSDRQKTDQWAAFTSRTPLLVQADNLRGAIEEIVSFVMPPDIQAVRASTNMRRYNTGRNSLLRIA